MREQLLKLAHVQTFDKTLYSLEQELKRIPARLGELEDQERDLVTARDKAADELAKVEEQKAGLEKDNSDITARLRRAEQRLMNSKTQREHRASSAEIDDGKDRMKANEDQLLEVMERFEAAKAKAEETAAKVDEFVKQAAEERGALDERAKSVSQEVDGLARKRDGMVKGVEPAILGQYDFIRKRSRGVALAGVREGSCLACHVDLPPQQYMELQRMDQLMSCPSCSRLLYWAEFEGFENFC